MKLPGAGAPVTNLNLPPPPGAAPGSGNWHVYPQGNGVALDHGGQLTEFNVWSGTPPGYDVYEWIPVIPGPHGTAVQINGYWVTTWPWRLTPAGVGPEYGPSGGVGPEPYWPGHSLPPPPPGAAPGGSWQMKHPAILTWISPSTANEADAQYLYGLGSTPESTPGSDILPEAQWQPGAGVWNVPEPTSSPIATTTP